MARNLIEEEYKRIEVEHLRDLVGAQDRIIKDLQEEVRSFRFKERDPILWRPVGNGMKDTSEL